MSKPQPPKKALPSIYTAAPLVVPEHTTATVEQELLRLPKNGTLDLRYQLSRSSWNLLILPCEANNFKPPIKSISLRKPGTQRGVRLIVASSAKSFFDRLIAEADATEKKPDEDAPKVRGRKARTSSPRQ